MQLHARRQALARQRQALGHQLGAAQMVGPKAQLQQHQQVAAGAAAQLGRAQRRRVGAAMAAQQRGQHALALLQRLHLLGPQRVVARVGGAAALVGRLDALEAHRVSLAKRECRAASGGTPRNTSIQPSTEPSP
jgi:hypothetical protein